MGICQSHSERENGGDRFHVDSGAIPVSDDQKHGLIQSIKSTPSRRGKSCISFAYDLALISPSEKTAATHALSPRSINSLPLSNPPNKTESPFEFIIDIDVENYNSMSDERIEDICPSIVTETFSDLKCAGIANQEKGSVNDEENYGLDMDHLADSLTTRANEFTDQDKIMHNDSHGQCDISISVDATDVDTHYCSSVDSHSHCPNIPPNTNQRLTGKPIQSMIQSIQEANEKHVSSKIEKDNCDHFIRYQMDSKLDPPPLLAPPKDVTIVTHPSNTETSVKPAIIATFNKIKTQFQQVHKQEKQRRQEEKMRDRRTDIKGYKELWGDFNEIKKRVVKHRKKNIESSSPNKDGEKISLKNSTTWFVDFSALDSVNKLDDRMAVDYLGTAHNIDQENLTSLPLLIQSSTFDSKRNTFRQEELQKRKSLGANLAGNDTGYLSPHRYLGIRESTKASENDHDLDLGNRSIISDLDNISNSSMTTSETDRAFDNDDYGVLHRYSRKSIETTVQTHTDNFDAQLREMGLHHEIPKDANAFLSALKSKKENSISSSFSKYLANNCLPSVSIENAETGLIRWREFPKNDTEVKAARKIDFSYLHNSMKKETGCLDHAKQNNKDTFHVL